MTSLSFCVLGSGSSGNCTLLTLGSPAGRRHVLIDAGLSPRRTAARLAPLGVALEQISAVLLTHVDGDHLHPSWPWRRRGPRFTWHCHRRHAHRARAAGLSPRETAPFEGAFEPAAGLVVEPTLLPHDALGSVGFVIDRDGLRLGYATDAGRMPPAAASRFSGLAALAIESNYDPHLQRISPRPEPLKRRITGGLGHLSNEQSLDAVLRIAGWSELRHVVLLHLSRQCNHPGIVRTLYAQRAPHLLGRLTITHHRRPTPMLHLRSPRRRDLAGAGRQLDFLETLGGPKT